ncbi:MAG: ATP-dependent Clp protease proteolytic subunit [Patescibacteria group bacterium]|nr:ATP-dependent Clp protease proteolytic subunit [Patescibacteria group bacterium]
MPNWKDILDELREQGSTHDIIRRKYLLELHKLTKRNVIAYYSGFLQKKIRELQGELGINDNDKNGFMTAIHKLDSSKGLDLILHTPGGEVAATESIIDYLTKKFDDIRIIVPQLAMSGGTMIACSGNKIVMGKQSSLGPIDPQFNGLPAHGILEEFKQAHEEIKKDNSKIAVWQPIIAKYHPTLIGECQKAVKWSKVIAKNALEKRMLKDDPDKKKKIAKILKELTSHSITLSHGRHLSDEKCKELGLVIESLEDSQEFQDAVLTIHHAFMHTLTATPAFKIIENHNGVAYIQSMQSLIIPAPNK